MSMLFSTKSASKAELKMTIVEAWDDLEDAIKNRWAKFRGRLEAIIEAKGG